MNHLRYIRGIRNLAASRTAKAAYVYVMSSGLNSAVPFLLIPVLTRLLTPADYGVAAVFVSVYTIANTATMFGLRSAVMRNFSVEASDTHADYLASNFAIVSMLALIGLAVIALGYQQLHHITGLSVFWLAAAVVSGAAMTVFQLFMTILQSRHKAFAYAVLQNTVSLSNILFSLLLIVVFHFTWSGRTGGVALSAILAAMGCLIYLHMRGELGVVRPRHVKEALALGSAGTVHAIAGAILSNADRFFLTAGAGASIVGVYATGNQFASILLIGGTALSTATTPWLFRQLEQMDGRARLLRLTKIVLGLCALCCLVGAALYVVLPFVFHIFVPQKYDGAMLFFPWLLGGALLNTLYYLFVPALFYYKRVHLMAVSGIFILIAGLSMMHLLGRLFGPEGVAMAMFGARGLLLGITAVIAIYLLSRDKRLNVH